MSVDLTKPIKRIVINIIPHNEQRYETCGDWQFGPTLYDENLRLNISISDTDNEASNMAVALHELIEAILCKASGVTQEQVDEWDMGPGKDLLEPGNNSKAPYHAQHLFATAMEEYLIHKLVAPVGHGAWREHNDRIDKLFENKETK